jgi:hypothetical protein
MPVLLPAPHRRDELVKLAVFRADAAHVGQVGGQLLENVRGQLHVGRLPRPLGGWLLYQRKARAQGKLLHCARLAEVIQLIAPALGQGFE